MTEDDKYKLTRQDEDISAPEYEAEEKAEYYDFGNWPEVFGLALAALLFWLSFAFTG
ncbi:hypothetical protein KM176_19535 [Pseudooceanicola sp. CBS1P-1]|uniref:hypothetical protein n=1 Tax=Pseudooceanicola TaxID=1679449 RepID=UPI0019294F5D|nr:MULTISPECIES: hypothetical protein [Pseudooceanicola]MBT9386073.1 hypothetical protein [Pseudooceanicola endophyticus]